MKQTTSRDGFSGHNIDYYESWEKPDELKMTMIDNENGDIFNFFHNFCDDIGLTKYRGIAISHMIRYYMKIHLVRYNSEGKIIMDFFYYLVPKSMPNWVDAYGSNAGQEFDMQFIVLDFEQNFKNK